MRYPQMRRGILTIPHIRFVLSVFQYSTVGGASQHLPLPPARPRSLLAVRR